MPQLTQTTVPVQNVREGDIVVRTFGAGIDQRTERAAVGSVKVGTKWTEVRATDGKLITRYELGMGVLVEREVPTAEETAAAEREYSRKVLQRRHESWIVDPATALITKMESNREAGYAERANYSDIANFLSHQAMWKLASQAESQAKYLLGEFADLDPVDALAAAYQDIVTKSVYPSNPLSRSSAVISNVMDDLDGWAKQVVIDELKYESVTYMAVCHAEVKARFASRKAAN